MSLFFETSGDLVGSGRLTGPISVPLSVAEVFISTKDVKESDPKLARNG